MDDMEPPEQFVETVVEDIHVGVDPGEEIVTSDSTVVTSGIGMNTVVFSQGPDEIIMEGDEIGGDIVADMVSDSLTVGKHSHILHSNSHHQNAKFLVDNMLPHSSIVVTSCILEPEYFTVKPHNGGEVIIGNNNCDNIFLEENVPGDMIIEQNVEIGGEEDLSHGEILLVPNSSVKQEDNIIEGEEVFVESVQNEIVIDQLGSSMDNGHFYADSTRDDCSDGIAEHNLDYSNISVDKPDHITYNTLPDFSYDCTECGARLKNKAALKKHIKIFHGALVAPEKPKKHKKRKVVDMNSSASLNQTYKCSSCPYTTQRRDKMDKHMQKHVLLEGYHPCGMKRQKPTSIPQRHRHNAEEYKCTLCPYTCTVFKALKKHHKVHLSSGKNVLMKMSCKICGKDKSSEAELRKHMKKHRDGKSYACDICAFRSLQLKKLIQHRRMHTGEKPHLCPHCIYRSARRDNLRSHVRRMHKKENVYIDTFSQNGENSPPE